MVRGSYLSVYADIPPDRLMLDSLCRLATLSHMGIAISPRGAMLKNRIPNPHSSIAFWPTGFRGSQRITDGRWDHEAGAVVAS